jgi:hypothetical protein
VKKYLKLLKEHIELGIFYNPISGITFSLNTRYFGKTSLIANSRMMGLGKLLLRLTAKFFNSLHLFFTPA